MERICEELGEEKYDQNISYEKNSYVKEKKLDLFPVQKPVPEGGLLAPVPWDLAVGLRNCGVRNK